MMKELMIAPAFMVIILTFAMNLVDIAESTTVKVEKYTEDMNDALDCAFMGIPLEVCSPDLMNTEFKSDINRTIYTVEEFNKDVEMYEKYNQE